MGSRVTRASGKRSLSAVTASTSTSPACTPPLSLKSLNPYRSREASARRTTASGVIASSRRTRAQASAPSGSRR